MILASNGIIASQILQKDADYLAFYNRVVTAGGSLTTTEQSATEQLVKDLKSYSIWTKMKAIYPMVGASAAACAQNLKSSSFTGTFNGGWTYASTGVKGNGSNNFMDTQLIPNSYLGQNSQSYFIYSRTNSFVECWDMGANSSTPTSYRTNITFCWGDGNSYGLINNATNILISASSSTQGFYGISRTAANLTKLFKNNNPLISSTAASNGNVNNSIYLAFVNNETYMKYSAREYAFASIGDGLTDSEASNLYTAVQTFNTTLLRQV